MDKQKENGLQRIITYPDELIALKEQVKRLEKENLKLKCLLDAAGILFKRLFEKSNPDSDLFDPSQGERILPVTITDDLANRFFARFWGRQNVFGKRSVKKNTGEVGYYPQYDNFWSYKCPRKTGKKIKCADCDNRSWTKLSISKIKEHLKGKAADASDVVGIYPLYPDDTCRFLVVDFDNHGKEAAKNDFANTDESWKEEVDAMREICKQYGLKCYNKVVTGVANKIY